METRYSRALVLSSLVLALSACGDKQSDPTATNLTIPKASSNPTATKPTVTEPVVTRPASVCEGTMLNNICYVESTEKLTWEKAKNQCEDNRQTLVSKESIKDWVEFASKDGLNLSQDNKYWLLEMNTTYAANQPYALGHNNNRTPAWSSDDESPSKMHYYICQQDSIAPTITASLPANNDVEVSIKASFAVTFDESVKPQTLTSTTVVFTKSDNNAAIETTLSYDNNTLTVKPVNDLETSTTYLLTLSNKVTDMYDNPLATSTIEFTSSAIADNCGGYQDADKCYTLVNTKLKHSHAIGNCYAEGVVLVSKDANTDFDAMANALSLDTSLTYSLDETNPSFPDYHYSLSYESNWQPNHGFTMSSDINAFICVK